jgi:hypothetical protein
VSSDRRPRYGKRDLGKMVQTIVALAAGLNRVILRRPKIEKLPEIGKTRRCKLLWRVETAE